MNVPSYVQADSPRNVKYFHVVVISTLPHFKSEEHSEEDTVQFMVRDITCLMYNIHVQYMIL